MLVKVIDSFVRQPLLLALGLVFILLGGLQGWQRMPVDLLPNLDVPVVNIISHLPGASPQDVELLSTQPIESAMQGIMGVHRVSSASAQGISQVSVQFDWGTSINDARQLVQARLSLLASTFPQGVTPRLEQIGTTLQDVAGYTITSPVDPVKLANAVRYRLIPRLTQIEGVSFVDMLGDERRAFVVHLRPTALIRLHLKLRDVTNAIRASNTVSVDGFAREGGREWLVRSDGRILTLNDLRQVALQSPGSSRPILLGEIADVHEARAPKHYVVHGDGRSAIALLVRKQPGASAIDVVQRVDEALSNLRTLLPAGSSIKKFYDQSEIIVRARSEIGYNLLLGAMLVVVVLYAFLGSLRPTLVVALTIPTTLLATVALMHALGLSLNVVTMTALALVIGMVVDDAIIVAENIARHRANKPIVQAAIDATLEIAGPDVSGTLTTVAVFLPLLVMGGLAALFLRPFGWTVSIALLLSLTLSILMVPSLSAMPWFNDQDRDGRRPKRLVIIAHNLLEHMTSKLEHALAWGSRHKRIIVLASLVWIGLAGALAGFGRFALLPPVDEGSVLVEYIMPPGTSLAESNRVGNELERIALKQPEVASVYRRTGSPISGYQIESVNRGEMLIKLIPLNERSTSADAMIQRFRQLYSSMPGMTFLFHLPTQEKMDESFSGLPALFGVTIYGEDESRLIELAQKVEVLLAGNPRISNIVNNTKVLSNQLSIRVRQGAAIQVGLTAQDVMLAVRAAGLGVVAGQVVRKQESFPILLRLKGVDFERPEDVRSIPVPTPDGGWVPLDRVADIQTSSVPATITRMNGSLVVTLLAEAEGDLTSVARSIQRQLDQMPWPPGYSANVSGQYPVLMHSLTEFGLAAVAAVALIYLIMLLQFRNWRQPLAILAVIPLALAGGIITVRMFGLGIDASIGMGALTLIGIAVNNGIVLIDFANRELKAGLPMQQAWIRAVEVRLRPVMMTALTTIASLLPLALGIGEASAIFRSFAIMVISGLLAAMIGTLILLPILQVTHQNSE
jgi:CzcA family heavy metal efflux pump